MALAILTSSDGSPAFGAVPKASPVVAGKGGIATQYPRRARRASSHLPPVEDGPQAGRPQVVMAAVPAEPALVAHVEQTRRVACARRPGRDSWRGRPGSRVRGSMAGGAGDAAVGRQAWFEEQVVAEADCSGIAGGAIAGIRRPCRRPGAVRCDALEFRRAEFLGRHPVGGSTRSDRPNVRARKHRRPASVSSNLLREAQGFTTGLQLRRRAPIGRPCGTSCPQCESARPPAA
jgi:hypothetical protein